MRCRAVFPAWSKDQELDKEARKERESGDKRKRGVRKEDGPVLGRRQEETMGKEGTSFKRWPTQWHPGGSVG